MAGFADCTSVTPACPVEATTYGYYPTLWANVLFCAIFGLLCIAQVVLGLWSRIRGYSIAVACGCLLECVGYGGRLIMHNNPWTTPGFEMQIVCLIIGPSFTAAGVYLTLKHAVRHNGAEFSRLKPAMYPWIFVCCDIGSILLQAAGGGVAASAGKTNTKLLSAGNNIIIAGIAFQVATMIICGILATDYIISLLRNRRCGSANLPVQEKGAATRAHLFQTAVGFAYLTILIRCIYRYVVTTMRL